MLQKLFQTILRRYFGQFLTGIENVQLTFWSGKINLHNISLKHQKINQILSANNIPFRIKYSHIGSLSIDIPWKSLSSTPVQIKISQVYVVLRMEKYVNVSKKMEEEKLMLIKNYMEYLFKKIMEDKIEKGDNQDGYFKKMVVKILHNLNAEVKDISIRVICQNQGIKGQNIRTSKKIEKKQKQPQPIDRASFMSISSGSSQKKQPPEQSERRASQTTSQFLRRNQKSFSFGFCLQQFSLTTVDQNFNKKFYNLDNKKSPVRKIMSLKQISLYLQEETIFNIFRVNQQQKIQFMKDLITREKYRLLSIDGRVVMNRNVGGQGENQFVDYIFKMQLQLLEVKATYGQLRQIIKIYANFSAASQTKQVKKLSQIPQSQQLILKPQYIIKFKQLYTSNFAPSFLNQKLRHILLSVSKKNILSWTKQCTIQIIKQKKLQNIRKQRNKKGWLSYLISQADVDITSQQIQQVYKQIQQLALLIDEKKIGFMIDFVFQKISIIISHEQIQEYLYFQLLNTQLHFAKVLDTRLSLSIQSMHLTYQNQKLAIKSDLLTRGPSQFYKNLITFQFQRKNQVIKVSLQIAQFQLNHQNYVLLLISQLIKLKSRQQMKSDIKLKKAQLSQTRTIQQQLQKNYQIDIKINKIIFKIQVNQISHVLISLQSITIQTNPTNKKHIGQIKNFNIAYVTSYKKLKQKQKQHKNNIIRDFTILFSISSHFNKIYTKMNNLQLVICQADLHSIYRSFTKQASIFKAQKVQQKNKHIHQYAYMRGHLKLLTVMKNWKGYQAILTDQGLFFFQQQPLDSQQPQSQHTLKHSHIIPISNCTVTIISQQQFKIQSDTVNQLIQCTSQQLTHWVQYINKIVFQNSSKAKMYKLLDQQQNKNNQINNTKNNKKYQTQIQFQLNRLQILVCQNRQNSLVKLFCNQIRVILSQNQLQFQRNITVQKISIKRLQNNIQTNLNHLITITKQQQIQPLSIKILGKKKLHPQYRGEIQIKFILPYIKINYDPQFIYKMIKKIAWGHQIPSYTNQTRNDKVLEYVKQFLRSTVYYKRQSELHSKDCKILENFTTYRDIGQYRAAGHTCQVLLIFQAQIKQLQINLINGLNNLYIFNTKAYNIFAKIEKGSQFLFFKLTSTKLQLYDITGYPYTNTKPYKQSTPYPLIYRKQQIKQQQGVQCYFSKFDLDRFINKTRIKSFFFINLYDTYLNYQNQLINRFFDYLFNQVIGFILAPHVLHKYDGPRRGPFMCQYNQTFTQKQIKQIISDCLQPFFTKILINAYNLTVQFNSFPKLQSFNLDIQSLKIESHNYQKNQKIRFNSVELSKIQKYASFKEIISTMPAFQEKLLKNHWVSRMDIILEGIKSVIFTNQLDQIYTYIERTIHTQKQLIFPYVSLDNSMFIQTFIKNLSIKSTKPIYNLINKCIMHNVSYDDGCQNHYTHNSMYKNFQKPSQLFYRLKSQSLQLIIPQLKTVIAIPDFQFKFIRYISNIKQMIVQGRSINIFNNNQIIMMTSQYKDKNNGMDINGLFYKIEMKLNGQKPMQARLSYIDINYNLQYFLKFGQFTILEQSCYPPLPPGTIVSQLPDLPALSCRVSLENSRIKLLVPNQQDDQFICAGFISLLWIRNSLTHPQKYVNNAQHFPQGKQFCSYRIQLKDLTIRKRQLQKSSVTSSQLRISSYNNNHNKGRYRLISNKISLIFKISQIMKLAHNQRDRYNDNIFDLKVTHIGVKLCYKDIQQLKCVFSGKQQQDNKDGQGMKAQMKKQKQSQIMMEESQSENMQPVREQPQPVQKPQQQSYISHTKYSITINKFQVQLGLSQLPVPLLDFILKQTKSNIQIMGPNTNIQLKTCIYANCWNMLIGRWQPIIEQLSPNLNCRIGQDKYILLDCNKVLLFNISLQSLKILKLLSSDFSQKGKFSILKIWNKQQSNSDNKVKGMNVSPYVLTNRTGLSLQVYTQHSQSKIKLKPQQKTYIDLKNYQIDFAQKLKIFCDFQNHSTKFQVHMDLAASKKITIQYKKRQFQLLLKPISNSIMKQIIISSLFIIQNKTSYALGFYYNYGYDEQQSKDTYSGRVKVMSKQKTALKFTANIKNLNTSGVQKNLKLQFPELQKNQIQNNFQFPYEALIKGYQHRIDLLKNKSFNCIVTIQQQLYSTIIVQPSFHVKNLLPLDIKVEFIIDRGNEKLIVPVQLKVNEEKDLYDFNSKEKLQVRLQIKGFNISPLQSITTLVNNQEQYRTQLDLIDYRGHPGKISIRIIKQKKVRRIFIYSQAVLINQTKYDIYTFTGSKLIPGQKISQIVQSQSNYTFINASQYQTLNFGFSDDNPFNSNQIKISQLGVNNVSMYKNQQLYQFTVKCNFHCLDNYALIYTYVLKLQPKYVIVNDTNFKLEITQNYIQNKAQFITSKQRLNWIWPVRTEPKTITLRIIQNQQFPTQWAYSAPTNLTAQDIQQNVIVLRPKDSNSNDKKLLKITPIKQNQSNYFLVEEVTKPQDYLLIINNELQFCKLRVFQQCPSIYTVDWSNNKYFQINPKNSIPFGWDFPNQPQNLNVQISFTGYLRTKFQPQNIHLNLQTQTTQKILIQNQDNQSLTITIKIQIIGLRKKITFCKRQSNQQQDSQLQLMHVGNRFAFSFTQIGISIISSVKKRSQLLFLSLKKLEIIIMEKRFSRSLQVKIKYINIDNNSNHNTIYPILLTPLKYQKTMKKSRPFFVMLFQQNLQSKDILQIKQLRVCIQPISIKIHDQILTAVMDMIQEINKQTDDSSGKINLLSIYRSYQQNMEWEQTTIIKPQRDIFFREFQIAKLALEITFSIRPKLNNNFIIMTILSSFGAAISNVSQAQLTLSRFLKKDKGINQLKTQISDFYFKQFMKGLYKVLGSINLFGNPYVFIKMIAEGAWEIVNQPTQGFIKGPIEGAIGIAKGGIFFTRNLVAGTCNSFEAISQSISRGVSSLTMDKKFIERRQKIKIQKSNHIFKGLQYGAFSIYTGIQVAITGLVRHPAEGYAKNGFLGGLTGTLKGFAGLVTKPISGTFQGISKISQGIKNTALMFQDGPNSKRSRPPRLFLTQLTYYKNYNIFQSTAISILQYCSTKYLNQCINYISLVDDQQKKLTYAYVLTQKYFSNVDILNKKLIRQIQIQDIHELKIIQNSLHIITDRDQIVIEDRNYHELFQILHKYYFHDVQ